MLEGVLQLAPYEWSVDGLVVGVGVEYFIRIAVEVVVRAILPQFCSVCVRIRDTEEGERGNGQGYLDGDEAVKDSGEAPSVRDVDAPPRRHVASLLCSCSLWYCLFNPRWPATLPPAAIVIRGPGIGVVRLVDPMRTASSIHTPPTTA